MSEKDPDKSPADDEIGSELNRQAEVAQESFASHDSALEKVLHDGAAADDIEGRDPDEVWLRTVYQGDKVPQFTLRAVLMGGILGSLMSISNLYTSIKLGWAFGVAITACVLSFVIWNGLRVLFPKLTPMSILENNCMQSTASAAGYSTGATVGTAFGALLLITGTHLDWPIALMWVFVTAALGVFLAVPMKRQMINREKLPFPDGLASAATLRSLYSQSKEAIMQARALVYALASGLLVGFFKNAEFPWFLKTGLKLPDLIKFDINVNNLQYSRMFLFGFEPSVLLVGAGLIVGMRVSLSMLVGSLILYFVVGPHMIGLGEATPEKLTKWSLWTGTSMLVTTGLMAFALQWKTILRAFTSIKGAKDGSDSAAEELAKIEVPTSWLMMGLIPLTIAMVVLQYVAFSIGPHLGVLSVVMSFFLALVACRSTGETNITPIGAMGKLTQLTYAVLAPSNITTNLMAGSVTANIASSSADLLTDLKSGYLLGANPRRQFLAQFTGLFFGALAVIPAWYLMIPNRETLEKYNPPSANMWKAVAEALSKGIEFIPLHARYGLLIGGLLGIAFACLDHFAPKKWKPYLPSAMGLGLSWVMGFSNSFSFFVGALIAVIWSKLNAKNAEIFLIPIASGLIAGESLVSALLAMYTAGSALLQAHP